MMVTLAGVRDQPLVVTSTVEGHAQPASVAASDHDDGGVDVGGGRSLFIRRRAWSSSNHSILSASSPLNKSQDAVINADVLDISLHCILIAINAIHNIIGCKQK